MSKPVTIRPAEEDLEYVEDVAREKKLPKASIIRELLHEAVEEERLKKAVENFKEGKVTLSEGAELAGISTLDFFEVLGKKKAWKPLKTSLKKQLESLK